MRRDYSGLDVHLARTFFPVIETRGGDKFRRMEHWSGRLQAWMREAGLTVPALAAASGVSEESLYKYLKGRTNAPRGDVIFRLASVFGRTAAELLYGSSTPTMHAVKKIPLLNMQEIASIDSVRRLLHNWQGAAVIVPAFGASEAVFALGILDNACAPKIEAGDVVVVDMAAIRAPGDFVVAYVAALDVAVCRRYRPLHAIRTDTFSLAAINADFPTIDIHGPSDGHVIGRVMTVVKSI